MIKKHSKAISRNKSRQSRKRKSLLQSIKHHKTSKNLLRWKSEIRVIFENRSYHVKCAGILNRQNQSFQKNNKNDQYVNISKVLASISSNQRITIIKLMMPGELTHKIISKHLNLEPGPLYHHLNALKMAGIIEQRIRNRYQLTTRGEKVAVLIPAMEKLVK